MEQETVLKILHNSNLFGGLDKKYIRTIFEIGNTAVLYKRDSVIEEGQKNHDIYIVLSGVLEIVLPKKNSQHGTGGKSRT